MGRVRRHLELRLGVVVHHPVKSQPQTLRAERGKERKLPGVEEHGPRGVVEVVLVDKVVLGGHGLGELAVDVDAVGLRHCGDVCIVLCVRVRTFC